MVEVLAAGDRGLTQILTTAQNLQATDADLDVADQNFSGIALAEHDEQFARALA